MQVGRDISNELHVGQVDDDELRYLLMEMGTGALHHGGQSDVIYGPGAQDAFHFKAIHRADGRIERVEAGPGLSPESLSKLGSAIEAELVESIGDRVGAEVLLSESPVAGYFRYADKFQILPSPTDAPRIVFAPGVSPRHPLDLEVRFAASRNPAINNFRRLKTVLDLELTLSALLRGSMRSALGTGRLHWVIPESGEPNGPEVRSQFLREGYTWPGVRKESETFTQPSEIRPILQIEPHEYYAIEPWSPSMSLTAPSNLSGQLDRYCRLNDEQRGRWLRACYWFQHSTAVRTYSWSAAYAALVIALEALIPEDIEKHRKQEHFEAFVERHLGPNSSSKEALKDFHNTRSQFLHGNEVHYFDRNPLWIGVTPAMQDSLKSFNDMRRIARRVLVNWLVKT